MAGSILAAWGVVAACAAAPWGWLAFDRPAKRVQIRHAWVSMGLLALLAAGIFAVTSLRPESFDYRMPPVPEASMGSTMIPLKAAARVGGPTVIVLVSGALAAFSWRAGRKRRSMAYVAALAGEIGASFVIKHAVARVRPAGCLEATWDFSTFSFPSGHASNSVLVYGALLLVLAEREGLMKLRGLLTLIYLAFITAMGVSRLMMRAHWGLDVLSGYALGGFFLALVAMAWSGHWCAAEKAGPEVSHAPAD